LTASKEGSMEDSPQSACLVRFFGVVQGVGFRALVKAHADRLHLGGHVRNLADGSVEAEIVGPETLIREVLESIRISRAHQIERIQVVSTHPALQTANRFQIVI
jgi:acylphosphatase